MTGVCVHDEQEEKRRRWILRSAVSFAFVWADFSHYRLTSVGLNLVLLVDFWERRRYHPLVAAESKEPSLATDRNESRCILSFCLLSQTSGFAPACASLHAESCRAFASMVCINIVDQIWAFLSSRHFGDAA